jgi:hypothetical protein
MSAPTVWYTVGMSPKSIAINLPLAVPTANALGLITASAFYLYMSCHLAPLADGRMGVSKERSARIACALNHTQRG